MLYRGFDPDLQLAYALGLLIGTAAFPLLGRQRRALEANLRRVRPDLSQPALRKLAWRNWLGHTKAWIDFFKIPRMDRRKLSGLLVPIGTEHLDAATALGRGVIVVAPHMGSWELALASWAARYGPIGVMAEQIEPRRLFEHVFQVRSRMGIKVIPLSRTAARDILRLLSEGRMVVLAMDREILGAGGAGAQDRGADPAGLLRPGSPRPLRRRRRHAHLPDPDQRPRGGRPTCHGTDPGYV